MLNRNIFRERALVRSAEPESLDDPTQVTAPHEWMLLAALAALLVCALAWAAFGAVERTLLIDCVMLRSGERHAVLSPVSGSVAEVIASAGDAVDAGAVIARVRLPELGWRARLTRARAAAIEKQAARADGFTAARLREALVAARAELAELAALEAAGGVIVSPRTGDLAALDLVRGQALSAGTPVAEVRVGGGGAAAAALLTPERARRIDPGMAARVALTGVRRAGSQAFAAEVAHVSPRPVKPSRWLSALEAGPGGGHLVQLALGEARDAQAPDGAPCRAEIVLGRDTPLGLLAAAAGNMR